MFPVFKKLSIIIGRWFGYVSRIWRLKAAKQTIEIKREESDETEQAKTTEVVKAEPDVKGSPEKEPPKRGPRRSSKRPKIKQNPSSAPKVKSQPLEIICRKSSGEWRLVLSAPSSSSVTEVRQGNVSLPANNEEYLLQTFTDELIFSQSGEEKTKSLFDKKEWISFKFRKGWIGDGHQTSGIGKGYFIALAPCDWTRIEHVSVQPEACIDPKFHAHFFYSDKNSQEDVEGFAECGVLTRSRFRLKGENQVFDDSDDGDLYSGAYPVLECSDISWVRIGEEREDGWLGENFKPREMTLEEVLGNRQGRFFIRVYDDDIFMVDSGEFRYCQDLRSIELNGKEYSQDTILIPDSNGHLPATLQFLSFDGTSLFPSLKTSGLPLGFDQEGIMQIPALPDYNEDICFSFDTENGVVDVLIKLPRVWWRITHSNGENGEWRDKPLDITNREFIDMGDARLEFKLPSHVESKRFNIGFGNNMDRNLSITDGLPLRYFSDYEEIRSPSKDGAVLQMQINQEILPLIRVTAERITSKGGGNRAVERLETTPRHYEIVFLVEPEQSEQVPAIIGRYREIIESRQGRIHRLEDWGMRRLAYPINRSYKAHYVLMNIECSREAITELKDAFRFSDSIIRNLIIRHNTAVTGPSPLKDGGDGDFEASINKEDKPTATVKTTEIC